MSQWTCTLHMSVMKSESLECEPHQTTPVLFSTFLTMPNTSSDSDHQFFRGYNSVHFIQAYTNS
jgi:hypothetical protein